MTTGDRTVPRALRLGAAAVLLAAALPLSSCSFPFTRYEGGATGAEPSTNPPASPISPHDAPTGPPSSLLFTDPSLPSGARVEWWDGLFADSGWKVFKPDDGNGHWSYATVDDVCTVEFWQGTSSSTGAKDDRGASDLMLAALTQATIADVTSAAMDLPLKSFASAERDVDTRMVHGTSNTASWVIQARLFERASAGVSFILDCTDGSATTVADEIIDKNPVVVG